MADKLVDMKGATVFDGVQPEAVIPKSELCTVLYGYGRVRPDYVQWVDDYKFTGGVAKSVPRTVANCWAKGTRLDGKPAMSRVYIQAILPEDAEEATYITATKIEPVAPEKLAAMIKASDAAKLVELLGKETATKLAQSLLNTMSGERK